jgi:hypothetical protein
VERFGVTPQPKHRRRYAFAAGVVALHAAWVTAFLLSDKLPLPVREPRPLEVTFLLKPLARTKPPPEPNFSLPAKKREQEKSNAITLPQTNETLGALERYLACQSNYENLTPEEQLRCAQTQWTPPNASTTLMLGLQFPSIWADAQAKRKAPVVPMLDRCPLDTSPVNSIRHQLGLGCFTSNN